MNDNRNAEKEQVNAAYAGALTSLSMLLGECAALARHCWNMEMRLLKSIGVMPVFVSHWWLFWVLGVLLLAFAFPIGVAFAVTALAAGSMEPRAKDEFIVPLKHMT